MDMTYTKVYIVIYQKDKIFIVLRKMEDLTEILPDFLFINN
jgi:hypothetical protein